MNLERRFNLLVMCGVLAGAVSVSAARSAGAQGIELAGVGAVNRSFGSAAVAAPLDAAGSIRYNPATMTGLKSSESQAGLELLWADTKVRSGVRGIGVAGQTDDDSGVSPIPMFAIASKNPDSDLALGLGFFGVGGFRTDYPSSATNPILTPQPPVGQGLGRVSASADIFQVVPALSYRVNKNLSIGASPILTIAKIEVSPFVFTQPDSNGAYPDGVDPDYRYGGGFQLGAFYQDESGFNFGVAYRSAQWMDGISINTTDPNGLPRTASFGLDLPQTPSVGISYTGMEQWVFAVDVRYLDYGNARGFSDAGYDSQGGVRGLGWDSVFAVSSGIQYSPTSRLSLRLGYTYNQNPISSEQAMFNVGSPLINQHLLGMGLSYEVVRNTLVSLAYIHAFENSVEGPISRPGIGQIPTSYVENQMAANAIALALTLRY